MIPALARRLPIPPRNEALPLALLLLALSSVFAFGNDRSQFYRRGHHDFISAQTLAVAANLSAEHGFMAIRRQRIGEDGEQEYVPYNPYPIGPTALVALALLPFGDDGARQVLAARLLMLGCFAAAAVFAYLALARLLGDRWIALAATLFAFSSYYLLYYGDVISAEMSTNILGIALVFHGLVLFAEEGRFRQLLARTAVALLLGWHVAGLIAPFVLIGLGSELARAQEGGGIERSAGARRPRPRDYLIYGAFSLLCCALLMGWNLASEYRALGGVGSPADLPSIQSLLQRSGIDEQAHLDALGLGWLTFLRNQLGGIAGMAIPFAAVDRLGLDLARPTYGLWPPSHAAPWFATLGAPVFAACLAGLRFLRCRAAVAALLLAGWCWAILFPATVGAHEFEVMSHFGIPLILCALALLGLRRLLGRERARRTLPAIALAAAAVFALSARDMAGVGHGAEAAQRQREVRADFRAVRSFTDGRALLLSQIRRNGDAPRHRISYWLAGSYLQTDDIGSAEEWARASRSDYAVLSVDLGGSLTPDNRHIFLYRPSGLSAAYAAVADREPGARSAFEVRLDGRTLTWTRGECSRPHTQIPFFVHAASTAPNPATGRREAAFETYAHFFPFGGKNGVRFGGKCIAKLDLPDEPIAGVRTGQRPEGLPALWEASLPVGDASFPRGASTWRDALAAPALASFFEVHADGPALTYARERCAEADTGARFFARVLPLDPGDLPADRQRYGSERLTFEFAERGLRYEGACLTAFDLPDYPVLGVRTGQYGEDGDLWTGEFPLDPEAWLARFEVLAASEPAVSSAFGVYLDGRTLHYARGECAASDVEARFFLHVTPLDADDLPEERRVSGFDNLDFSFGDRGLRYGGRCLASAPLPDYGVASVRTGQFAPGGEIWEGRIAFGD